jgi:hypothetical protein
MHLFTRCFVAGSVVARIGGAEECVAGAEVVLKCNGRELARTATDTFGDFKFDKLEPKSGAYEVQATATSLGGASKRFELGDESLYLGAMTLAAGN